MRLVRDPRLRTVFAAPVEDLQLAALFDGRRTLAALAAASGRALDDVAAVARAFEARHLLDTPDARAARPEPARVPPPSALRRGRGLTVLPEVDPRARFTCHACGHCCRGFVVELSPEEEARIDAPLYRDLLGDRPFVEEVFVSAAEPARRVLRHRDGQDDPCVFLLDDARCAIHARQGMEAKPDACRAFPFVALGLPRGRARLGVRMSCRSMWRSYADGRPVEDERAGVLDVFAGTPLWTLPRRVDWLGETVEADDALARLEAIAALARPTLDAAAVRRIDRAWLGGRVARARRRYGRRLVALAADERARGRARGAESFAHRLDGLRAGAAALDAMAANRRPPAPRHAELGAFLAAQLGHVLHALGPAHLPDLGLGAIALLLAVEATLHAAALGRGRGRARVLAEANAAFDVFTGPLLELPEHAWPILDAIDPRYTSALIQEIA